MALRGKALTTGKVKGPVSHHCVLCTAAGVAEIAGVGLLMQQGYSSAESNQAVVSADFEGLSIALVSFLCHLPFTGCMRNSIQIFFCLVRSLAHMHT